MKAGVPGIVKLQGIDADGIAACHRELGTDPKMF
jgi:hypothetical protein